MKISGHKTDSVYRRYRIVSEQDVRRAMVATETYVAAAPSAGAVRLAATVNAPR